MDWFSRKVLAWRISNTLDVPVCIEALQEALSPYGTPEVFNSDQGSQFTCKAYINCLRAKAVQISMGGRGRCHDNIFIVRVACAKHKRLWRSIKYELIYLKAFEDGLHLSKEVGRWFEWYNQERFHQALGYKTPNQV
jgi:putative transposase